MCDRIWSPYSILQIFTAQTTEHMIGTVELMAQINQQKVFSVVSISVMYFRSYQWTFFFR
jgi:hypothetical protein